MLTDAGIRQAIKAGRNATLTDGRGRGTGRLALMVRAMPGRVIAEFYAQQWANGRRRLAKIGAFPEMSLAEARSKFQADFSGVIRSGENIKYRRDTKPGTVRDLFNAYVFSLEQAGKESAWDIRRSLDRVIVAIGPDKAANEVKTEDVVEAIRPVYASGSKGMADHMRAYVRAAFSWGKKSENDYRKDIKDRRFNLTINPAADIPTEARTMGNRWLTVDEIRALWAWCDSEMHGIAPSNIAAVKMCLLTGQRVKEITRIHVDMYLRDEQLIEWPTTKTKRPHAIPLPPQAVEIMNSLTPSRHGWFFPMIQRPAERVESTTIYDIITRYTEAHGVPWFTPRDFRRTWKTLGGFAGIPKDVRDHIQNHAKNDVSSRHYDRYEYMKEKRSGMDTWGKWFDENILKKLPDQRRQADNQHPIPQSMSGHG